MGCRKSSFKREVYSDTHLPQKLEINYRKKGKIQNVETKQQLLKIQWINEEIEEEIRKYIDTSENGSTISQNLWDTVKAVLRWQFIVIQAYLKK